MYSKIDTGGRGNGLACPAHLAGCLPTATHPGNGRATSPPLPLWAKVPHQRNFSALRPVGAPFARWIDQASGSSSRQSERSFRMNECAGRVFAC